MADIDIATVGIQTPAAGDHVLGRKSGNLAWFAADGLGGGGATDPEVVRDTIAAALVAGSARVTVTPNDAADTITVDVPAASISAAGAVELATTAEATTGTDTTRAVTAAGLKAVGDTKVPLTLVDAKGDLLVGSAADALARLGVGADGTVLTADTTAATGVKWAAPAAGGGGAPLKPVYAPTGFPVHALPGVALNGVNVQAFLAGRRHFWPIVVDQPVTVDALVLEVTAAGAAGKSLRAGIYNTNTSCQPTTVVADAGTVAADTTGVKTLTFGTAVTLTAGTYLLALGSDGAPTVRALVGHPPGLAVISDTLGSNAILRNPGDFGGVDALAANPTITTIGAVGNVLHLYGVFPRITGVA